MPRETKRIHYDGAGTMAYLDSIEKLYTQKELDKAVRDEREDIIKDGIAYAMYNTPPDMCRGDSLRAYSKGIDNFVESIRDRT